MTLMEQTQGDEIEWLRRQLQKSEADRLEAHEQVGRLRAELESERRKKR
jgi:hypothetical protein